MRFPLIGLLLLAAATGATAADGPAFPLPLHPRLLLDAAGVEELRARIVQPAWSNQWMAFRTAFDHRLTEPVELPPRGGNWYHWYICPEHGATLITGRRLSPWTWEHRCPVGGEVWRGDPSKPSRDFDGCILAHTHSAYANATRDAGLLFAVTGDARYRERGRAILLAYAHRYATYPLHNTQGRAAIGGGRIGAQTLDESVWLIPAAEGADLLWTSLDEADRRTIANQLFLPAARQVIQPHRLGVHNIQCWMNSAIGLTGLLLDDASLVRFAIDDPDTGYRTQMARGVLGDGLWYEGAWGYHFYTVNAVMPLVEAARHCGLDLYGEPLHRLFAAPLELAMPNLHLPAFNDSHDIAIAAPPYELAYARYRDPLFLQALADGPRNSEQALWYGVDPLPPAHHGAGAPSRNDTGGGYAILRQGDDARATWLCLKYGPHGGGHGHPDKLSFVLYADGRTVCPDVGARNYGSPLHLDWDKTTLAHNTLVVGLTNQLPVTGRSLAFGASNGISFAMADAGPIYPDLRFVRTALLCGSNLVVFVDRIESARPQLLDLACHVASAWSNLPPGTAFDLPGRPGYRRLAGATTRANAAGLVLRVTDSNAPPCAIVLADNAPTEIITATGVGASTADRVPLVLFRRTAAQATFVWALALDGRVPRLEVLADSAAATTVRITAPNRAWQVSVDRAAARVTVE